MMALLLSTFWASLLGSLHCATMCGGFVAFYMGNLTAMPSLTHRLAHHVVYHFGRLTTYLVLGCVAGSVGAAVNFVGDSVSLHRLSSVIAGALMLLMAISLLLSRGTSSWSQKIGQRLFRPVVARLARYTKGSTLIATGLLGLVTTLLPCGWLYAFVIVAGGTGDALSGVLIMSSFWLGTVPILLGLGVIVNRVANAFRRYVPMVTATTLLVIGLITLLGRASLPTSKLDEARHARSNNASTLVEKQREAQSCHDSH